MSSSYLSYAPLPNWVHPYTFLSNAFCFLQYFFILFLLLLLCRALTPEYRKAAGLAVNCFCLCYISTLDLTSNLKGIDFYDTTHRHTHTHTEQGCRKVGSLRTEQWNQSFCSVLIRVIPLIWKNLLPQIQYLKGIVIILSLINVHVFSFSASKPHNSYILFSDHFFIPFLLI